MNLSLILRAYRRHSERTLRDLSSEIGIPVATLNRVENGECMDGRTLAAILRWMLLVTVEDK